MTSFYSDSSSSATSLYVLFFVSFLEYELIVKF